MGNCVKIALEISIYDIHVALIQVFLYFSKCIFATFARTKSIAVCTKFILKYWFDYELYCTLDYPIFYTWNA